MQESFTQLSGQKRGRIIQAAMKVFAQSPYKKASTDDIAALAGISKGLLFYHFKSKKELYCFLYEYSCKRIYATVEEQRALEEADFFERNKRVIKARVCTLLEYPYLFDFALRAYYETDSAVEDAIHAINRAILVDAEVKLHQGIDTGRFKNPADIPKAIQMMVWIGDGFIKERMADGCLDLQQLQDEACAYLELLKHGFYT